MKRNLRDPVQVTIVAQNAMGHAVNIIKHNSEDKKIKLEDVLAAARIITEEMLSIADDLSEKAPKKRF